MCCLTVCPKLCCIPNSTGHIKSTLTGNHCVFPLIDGEIICGGAQDIYLVEFDGPQLRRIYVETIGE
ncbi:MAG TPA: YjbQ family protein [Alphaproteobacteria bacterium]|nr:YjbQ family protein [Alphaproteobacteria bacterium]